MKLNYWLILSLAGFFLFSTACSDDDTITDDNQNDVPESYDDPAIEVHEPDNHATFQQGQNIALRATITTEDPEGLHRIDVVIANQNTGVEYEYLRYDDVDSEFEVDANFLADFSDPVDLDLLFRATDHEEQQTSVLFTLHVE